MNPSTILAAIAGLGTIVGGVVFGFRWIAWKLQKTPAQSDQETDADIAKQKAEAENTGRPV